MKPDLNETMRSEYDLSLSVTHSSLLMSADDT